MRAKIIPVFYLKKNFLDKRKLAGKTFAHEVFLFQFVIFARKKCIVTGCKFEFAGASHPLTFEVFRRRKNRATFRCKFGPLTKFTTKVNNAIRN